jgi:acetyl esterase
LHPALTNFTAERQDHSEFEFFAGPIITVPFAKKTFSIYVPDAHDRNDELAAPINISASHAKLQPPTLIINSAVDLLRSEGNLYGEILQKNGVDCAVLTTHGQVHDSEVLEATRTGPTPRASLRLVARSLVEAFGTVADVSKKRKVEKVQEGNGEMNGQVKKRKRRTIKSSY